MNNVSLIGRLTYEPELKSTPSGVSVLSFQIAVDRKRIAAGSERKADFIDCIAWRHRAEFISRYFHKGQQIAVEGEIQTRDYTDTNGNKRKVVEVVVNSVFFCGSKPESNPQFTPPQKQGGFTADNSDFEEIPDDDLPF